MSTTDLSAAERRGHLACERAECDEPATELNHIAPGVHGGENHEFLCEHHQRETAAAQEATR